ncbi:MAG: hypothetical protein Q8O52_16135 [Sulfuritalea sp.]|nr:hypothetical protein [Sulfuritalea sp.]
MRTLAKKYLGGLPIEENAYKVDLAVLERYQSFSSELLRLSLLGIAGYGFLIANVIFKAGPDNKYIFLERFANSKYLLAAGAIALGISAVAALGHRYFSTDCLTHFVRRVRLSQRMADTENPDDKRTIEHEEESLDADLTRCKWFLEIACISLLIGVACVAFVFASTLFIY